MYDCGRQSGNVTGFSLSTSVSPHSIVPTLLHMKLLIVLLQEQQAGEAKKPLNNSMFFAYRKEVDSKVFTHFYARIF